jgi:hypothetical protein
MICLYSFGQFTFSVSLTWMESLDTFFWGCADELILFIIYIFQIVLV